MHRQRVRISLMKWVASIFLHLFHALDNEGSFLGIRKNGGSCLFINYHFYNRNDDQI